MRADIRQLRHGVAHQTADASIAVWERMDVVETVMGGGHGHDAACLFEWFEVIALFEILHEIWHAVARWRDMATHSYVMFVAGTPCTGLHEKFAFGTADGQHFRWSVVIEFPMKPLDEFYRCGFGQFSVRGHEVELTLHAHMRGCFDL